MAARNNDWMCQCGTLNFGHRDMCFKCNTFKSKAKVPSTRPGDWQCPHCMETVFASRPACRKCGTSKADAAAAAAAAAATAPVAVAESLNVASAPSTAPANNNDKAPTMELGDWLCSICKSPTFNFKTRSTCFTCGEAKEKSFAPSTAKTAAECIVCMDKDVCMLILTCRHHIMCETCCFQLDKCPMCSKPYHKDDVVRIFSA